MPTHFTKTDENGTETLPFTRFHFNEVTGKRVPTTNDIFNLTEQQAIHLVNSWNQMSDRFGHGLVYAVYDNVE